MEVSVIRAEQNMDHVHMLPHRMPMASHPQNSQGHLAPAQHAPPVLNYHDVSTIHVSTGLYSLVTAVTGPLRSQTPAYSGRHNADPNGCLSGANDGHTWF